MLTVDNCQANYYLPKGSPDPAAVRKRLDRVVRGQLPAELKGRLRPSTADREAVYRIRQLDIDLWVDVTGMSDAEIARIWSRLLLKVVTRTLMYGLPSEVVRYDNHAHYVAAFLSDLLAGHAWSRWVYDEFLPMRDLPVGQIAAFLLAPRLALLLPVARRLERDRRLESLVQRLQPADLSLIWEKGLGFGHPPIVLSIDSRLKRILATLQNRVVLEQGDATTQARNILRIYLAAAMAQPELAGNKILGAVCYHLALLHRVWTVQPASGLWMALARQEIATPEALEPVLSGLDQVMAQAHDWLVEVLASLDGRAYLAQLVPVAVPDVWSAVDQISSSVDIQQPSAIRISERVDQSSRCLEQVATAFAGLALLLPAIRELRLNERVGKEGFYQLLLAAVGLPCQPLAWSDAGPARLVGVPQQEMENARTLPVSWPDMAQWADPDEMTRAGEQAADHLGPLPGSAFALLVLQRFALGLRGFADSSPGYLAKQFINQSGHIKFTEKTIDVYLSRSPLGVVLHMAGRDGDQGPVPWLDDRCLYIHLPDG